MLNTYLNDNLNTPYPFFQGQLPFPMTVITGLGLCLHGESNGYPLYALDVNIGKDFVFLAIGRDSPTNSAGELFGVLWANTSGSYAYFRAVWGYGSQLTFWYPYWHLVDEPPTTSYEPYDPPPNQEQLQNPVYAPTASIMELTRVYFDEVRDIRETPSVGGAGYMTLGTIPAEAVGSYRGKFYLDPSCVRWMPTDVFGYHTSIAEFANKVPLGQRFDISTSGVLSLSVGGSTATVVAPAADDYTLTSFTTLAEPGVRTINGLFITGETSSCKQLEFRSDLDSVSFSVLQGSQDPDNPLPAVISIEGGTDFPNCYSPDDEHQVEAYWDDNA